MGLSTLIMTVLTYRGVKYIKAQAKWAPERVAVPTRG